MELTHVEQLAPDAVGVVFLAAADADGDEIDDIAAELPTALGIGPGTNQRVSRNERHVTDDEDFIGGVVRGIGGESAMCSACGLGAAATFWLPASRLTGMSDPTNLDPRRYVPRTGRNVWALPSPVGYLESIQSAGSVRRAVAGGCELHARRAGAAILDTVRPLAGPGPALLRRPRLAQIFAVQSVIWTRRYMATPDELKQWYPDDFTPRGERPTQWLLNVQGRQRPGRAAMGQPDPRLDQRRHIAAASGHRRGSGAARSHQSHALGGGDGGVDRRRPCEASWVIGTFVDDRARLGMTACAAAIITSGGSYRRRRVRRHRRDLHGAPATWWAVALAVVAMPFWLAVLTGARYSQGHLRLYSPLSGAWADRSPWPCSRRRFSCLLCGQPSERSRPPAPAAQPASGDWALAAQGVSIGHTTGPGAGARPSWSPPGRTGPVAEGVRHGPWAG